MKNIGKMNLTMSCIPVAVPRFHQISRWMNLVTEQYKDVVTQHVLGMTYENQTINYLKIGEKSGKSKKVIWMDCGIHAREWISPAFCQWFVKELLENYKTDEKIGRFFQNMDFYVVPLLNMDGYNYTWTENCCSEIFCGSKAESESEVKAVVDLVGRIKNDILCFLTIHSYGQLILMPYGHPNKTAPNHDEHLKLGQNAANAIKQKHGTSYRVGPPSQILYPNSGSSRDWARDIGIEFSYTFELRDNGTYGFELPEDQIQPTCEEAMAGVNTIVEYVHNKHFGSAAAATVALWSTVLASYLSLLVIYQEQALQDYSYTRYHPMEQIYEWMDKVKNQYQDVVSQHFLGTTYEKRPIYFFKIGEKSDKPKKMIWMDCGIHAREWISPAFCQWFVKEDRLWRKSRSPSPFSNCTSVGTDLNRNFDSAWCCIGGSRNCSSQTFCGSAPGSESESKAVMELVNNKKNDILCFLTIHSYGQLIMTPFGEPGKTASNHDELMEVGQLASRAVEQKHGISYTVGPPSVVLYNYTGSSHDWARDIGIEFSYTFELRDNGTYGFELPEDQIQPTCEEAMAGVTTIVEYVHNKHFGSAAAATVALWSTVLASYLSLLVLVQ
ncbi:Carboxypeptidase O [Acipenser ruthenus]|uniref:Carboxypeptidase O n=1 Tax=Acipenser ruthenus TaxID=7906 RepID=A0A662YSJ7_ACIRT|nr:Carboxypeptidase O [Acipenser ruthenus]